MPKKGFKITKLFLNSALILSNTSSEALVQHREFTVAQLKFTRSCNITVSKKVLRWECKPVFPSLNMVPAILSLLALPSFLLLLFISNSYYMIIEK